MLARTGWRAWFECAHHRAAQRRSSGLSLVHHLLTLLSSRRCAPESVSFSGPAARARAAFRKRAPQSHADAQARCDCGARSRRTARPTTSGSTDCGSDHFCDKRSDLHVPTAGPGVKFPKRWGVNENLRNLHTSLSRQLQGVHPISHRQSIGRPAPVPNPMSFFSWSPINIE